MPEPEIEGQLFLDSMQPVDIDRVMGNPHQRAELDRIQRISESLGWLITSYAIRYGGMIQVQQTNGVNHQGFPFSEVSIK